jgi:hypothetical protein
MAGGGIPRTGTYAAISTSVAALPIVTQTTDLSTNVTKVRSITFIGDGGNTLNIYVGGEHATDHVGVPLPPGASVTFVDVNITNFYISADTLGNRISWVIIE